jgi:ribonuclease VapC
VIVDSSAVVAIIEGEVEEPRCRDSLIEAPIRRISAANLLETYMRIDRSRLPQARLLVDDFIDRFAMIVMPVTHSQIVLAREAFHRYGKGSGHGAGLNYGDCFAYALAKETGEPLLFVGNDFSQTDIGIA